MPNHRQDDRPGDGTVTWRALWAEATAVLPRHQARWVCEVASGLDADELVAALDEPATQRCVAHLDAMLGRLRAGEPLQYVLGRWSFRHLDLLVDRRVLIPRPETELVVDVALELARAMPAPRTVVDLGTGSGAIGLALAGELPIGSTTVWLTDRSPDALDVARSNVAGLGRAGAAVRIAEPASWFDALPDELRGSLQLVVSNPPYVAAGDETVEPVVRDWEPAEALVAGDDGLDAIRAIAAAAPRWLAPGGWLVLEIGAGQGADVSRILGGAGFDRVEILPDLAAHDRIARAHHPSSGRAHE